MSKNLEENFYSDLKDLIEIRKNMFTGRQIKFIRTDGTAFKGVNRRAVKKEITDLLKNNNYKKYLKRSLIEILLLHRLLNTPNLSGLNRSTPYENGLNLFIQSLKGFLIILSKEEPEIEVFLIKLIQQKGKRTKTFKKIHTSSIASSVLNNRYHKDYTHFKEHNKINSTYKTGEIIAYARQTKNCKICNRVRKRISKKIKNLNKIHQKQNKSEKKLEEDLIFLNGINNKFKDRKMSGSISLPNAVFLTIKYSKNKELTERTISKEIIEKSKFEPSHTERDQDVERTPIGRSVKIILRDFVDRNFINIDKANHVFKPTPYGSKVMRSFPDYWISSEMLCIKYLIGQL